MNNTQLQKLQKVSDLQTAFTGLYILDGDTFKPRLDKGKNIYDSKRKTKLAEFEDGLNSVGIDSKSTPKQIELSLQQKYEELYELLKTAPKFKDADRPNDMPEKTTLNATESVQLQEEARIRNEQIAKTRENAKVEVARAQEKLKEIYNQQKIIQEQIKKAEELQQSFVDKKVYVTVEQPVTVTSIETQKSFETLTEAAIYNEYDLTEQLTVAIQEKAGIDESEILIAKTLAVQMVADIAHTEDTKKEVENIAIEEAISRNENNVLDQVLKKDEALIEIAKKGFVVEAEKLKGSVYLTREIAENLFGENVANEIYGPKQIKVTIVSEKNDQTTHEVDLGNLNKASIKTYKERYDFFENIRKRGIDETKNIFRSQLNSNVNTYLSKKAISSPDSLLGKVGSSDAVKAILTKGSPSALELKYFGNNKLIANYFKYSPESMPYFKLFTEVTGVSVGVGVATKIVPLTFGGGAIPITKIAYIQRVTPLRVPYTLGRTVGEKFAVGLGARTAGQQAVGQIAGQTAVKTGVLAGFGSLLAKGAAALGVSLGFFTVGVSTVVTLAITAVGKMINLPKIKQWFRDNKEIFVVGGAGAGLVLGGPVVGLVTGGLLMAATGTLGVFAAGTLNVLGFIGRSIGVAIATPVIVTLLVLPPLVAFIMLVINNSAYVVPPAAIGSKLGADNPYMLVTKTAVPDQFSNPVGNQEITVTYTVEIRALKDNLKNIKILSTKCKVIKKNKTNVSCPKENIPDLPPDLVISPASPYSFTFTGTYNSAFENSLIVDSIEVSADTEEEEDIVTSGSESVCVGDCPKTCVEVADLADTWPSNLKTNSIEALTIISEYQGFTDKMCSTGNIINLCYKPSAIDPDFYAWYVANTYGDNCHVYFNEKGVGNPVDASFLITHELTHHIQSINGGEYSRYKASSGWYEVNGRGFCTYSQTVSKPSEAMAEAAGLYVNIPSWGSCASPYKSKYPNNYSWAQSFME